MPKPDAQYVNCVFCTRGPRGNKSCASGQHVYSANGGGCMLGAWKPHKVPKSVHGAKVERVEAPSYRDAWDIARQERYEEWIWVKDGVPQESR